MYSNFAVFRQLQSWRRKCNTYLGYHTDIHIAATTQVIEDTSTDGIGHKLYPLLPLEGKMELVDAKITKNIIHY